MYQGQKVIDVHGHMTTPDSFRNFAMTLMSLRSPGRQQYNLSDDELRESLLEHIEALDKRNIDYQLVSPRPVAMLHWESPHIQEQWCRVTNDVIAQSVKLFPDRFGGIAQLPQSNEHPDTSFLVEELERAVKDLGMVGALLNPDPSGMRDVPGVNEKYWYPLYEKAQELDVPLLVHPSITKDRRVRAIPHNYQINNVWEEYLATLLYIATDVFQVFPRLKVVICHAGGGLSRHFNSDIRDGHPPREEVREKYFNNLFFDTCVYDGSFMDTAVKQHGIDSMVFGTEIGAALRVDVVGLIDGLKDFSVEDKVKIFNTNPKRVYSRMKVA
ncbi:MAG TPA: amidohydrolase family protein [Chloroflexota bacterium]|nr:amidohydrolase family protein [Chloroflexota bacterium]